MSIRNVQDQVSSFTADTTSIPCDAVATVIEQLLWQADRLSRKQCTYDQRSFWQARGQEHALRRAVGHLRVILTSCSSTLLLAEALEDYLACLEKCQIDAQEERHATDAMTSWKASGETEAWALLIALLTPIADACTQQSTEVDSIEQTPCARLYRYGHQVFNTSFSENEKGQMG